ncbi:cytochrome c [Altererythrobacter lauratis]|uniref:C-type cytochrome n=1 Tax=Alteraurantiacibacter lauratis TaxID=2054627 RepID=A0ABV7EK49_9SPHN
MRKSVVFGTALAVALAGCAGVAVAQNAATQAAPAAAPAGPPPGMPQPITMAQRPGAIGGEALYVEYCIACHGPNGMGTGLLQRAGRPQPLLEARGGMPAAFVIAAARNGIGNMPAIPRGEVSDEQLQAIADYLAAGPHAVAGGA